MSSARRGRPRKAGKRKPSGDLRFVPDAGSEDLHRHRAQAATEGAKVAVDTSDRRLSYPLGIMFIRREVSAPQHYAGRRYLGLFLRAVRGVGVPSVFANLLRSNAVVGQKVNDFAKDEAEIRADYLAARGALERSGRAAVVSVDNVVVYELSQGQAANRWFLHKGLDALFHHFRIYDGVVQSAQPARSQPCCASCCAPFNRFSVRIPSSLKIDGVRPELCAQCANDERRLIVLAQTNDIPEQVVVYRKRLAGAL